MSEITPVTHTEKVVAGQVTPVTHFEQVIAEYGGGGGGGGFTPTDAQLDAMNSGITSEDVEQISTNKNNISLIDDTYTNEYENVELTFTVVNGYYERKAPYDFISLNGVSNCELSCNVGDKYRITGIQFYQALRVVFMNGAAPIGGVWSEGNRLLEVNTYFTIPANCTSIIVQRGYASDKIKLEKATTALIPKTSLTGKKLCVIGDSITEWNGKANTNWVKWLADWNSCSVTNLGIGGTGFARGGDNRYINRISSIPADTDIIGIAVSFNDMAEGLPIGSATDTGTSSLCGYANDFFTALLNQKTSIPMIVYIQSPWGNYRPSVQASDDWVEMLITICRSYGVPYYDNLYYGGTLKPWRSANKATYYTPDDTSSTDMTHPNSIGHKTIAKALQQHFVSNTI